MASARKIQTGLEKDIAWARKSGFSRKRTPVNIVTSLKRQFMRLTGDSPAVQQEGENEEEDGEVEENENEEEENENEEEEDELEDDV